MIYTSIQKQILGLLIGSITLFIFQRCDEIEGVSLDLNSDVLGVNSADTFAVASSTFLMDPLPTGNQGALLLGAVHDPYFGTIKSSTYFRLAQPDLSTEFTDDVQFDSLTIELIYNGYYKGDTTRAMTLNVYQLTEDIELRELSSALEDDEYPVFASGEALYNDQSFTYASQSLGSINFMPRPLSTADTILQIRLDQNLGSELFQMVVDNDNRLIIEDEFLQYLRGLAIVPNDDAESIIGFQNSITFNLHYSYERQSDGMRINDEVTFAMGNNAYQYNKFETDRSNSSLAALSYENPELSASVTDQRTFIQGGAGIVTRINFPNIRQTLGLGPTAINSAQLIIETDQPTIGYTAPPEFLILFIANRYATPTSTILDSQGQTFTASYQLGNTSGGSGRGRYVFNITNYLAEIIRTENFDEEQSLLLSLPVNTLMSTAEMLRIAQDEDRPAIKLNVLYTKTQ